jgi:hypothetical protein
MKSTSSPFVETQTAVYDPYAQSWRYLGIVATCDNDGSSCPRSLLWAAYVDPHYSGNGVRAYQYHQPYGSSSSSTSITAADGNNGNGEWITTACANPKKCAKLDCHEPHTRMRLLGIFKEPYYASEWFEQLFKHAGSCHWVWQQPVADDDGSSGSGSTLYDYMQTYYANWPEQVCMATGEYGSVTVGSNNNVVDGTTTTTTTVQLYFDLKPGNSLRYGLYADAACRVEYVPLDGSRIDDESYQQRVRSIAANLGYLADPGPFNRALHVFQSCQLCRSSNLAATASDDQQSFHCYDDADYRNVNQCMKFRTHTSMAAVNWRDLEAAYQQGVLDSITVQGQLMVASTIDARKRQVGQTKAAVGALVAAVVAAILVLLWRMGRRQRRRRQVRAQPDLIERLASF